MSVEFSDDRRADDIEETIIAIENRVRKEHPSVRALFIMPRTHGRWKQRSSEFGSR